jgi:MYXO-CTERM domain-containing protein
MEMRAAPLFALLLCAPAPVLAEGSGGSGGRTGSRSDFPCDGCLLVTPAGYDPSEPTPLLVTFHGDEGEPDYIHGSFEEPAPRAGFLLVSLRCPRDLGCDGSWWQWEAYDSGHDFAWVGEQVDAVEAEYNVERNKIYLAGFSGGSSYLSEYLPRFSERYAGGIYLGGGYEPYDVDCPPCDVPVVFIIGEYDFLLDGARELEGYYERCGHDVDFQLEPGTDHQIVDARLPPVLSTLADAMHPCRAPPPPMMPDAGLPERPDAGSRVDAGAPPPMERPDAGGTRPPPGAGPGGETRTIVGSCAAAGPGDSGVVLLLVLLVVTRRRSNHDRRMV